MQPSQTLQKVFGRVLHEVIWCAVRTHNVPEENIKWNIMIYCVVRKRALEIHITSEGSAQRHVNERVDIAWSKFRNFSGVL